MPGRSWLFLLVLLCVFVCFLHTHGVFRCRQNTLSQQQQQQQQRNLSRRRQRRLDRVVAMVLNQTTYVLGVLFFVERSNVFFGTLLPPLLLYFLLKKNGKKEKVLESIPRLSVAVKKNTVEAQGSTKNTRKNTNQRANLLGNIKIPTMVGRGQETKRKKTRSSVCVCVNANTPHDRLTHDVSPF